MQPHKRFSLYGYTARAPHFHTVLLVVGFCFFACSILGRFLYLNVGDFTDWDESLYAWRAKVAVIDGKWLDQSAHSFGGFYSGSFPPLLIWQMAGMMSLFGLEEWAARLPSAAHGAAALIAIFFIGRAFAGRGAGIFAACMAGSIDYVLRFSRDAQFDVPYTAWMFIFTAFYLWGMKHPEKRKVAVRLAGVAMGCGLMTKIAVPATAAVSLFLWQILLALTALRLNDARWLNPLAPDEFSEKSLTEVDEHSTENSAAAPSLATESACRPPVTLLTLSAAVQRYLLDHLVILGYALVIWLPWHVYMFAKHGFAFTDWYIFQHLIGKNKFVQDFHDGVDNAVANAAFFYPYSAWDRIPEALYPLAFVALCTSIIWIFRVFLFGKTDQHSGLKSGGSARAVLSRPDPRRSVLPGLWLGLIWVLFLGGGLQLSATKREIYLIPIYCMLTLMAALYLMYWIKTPSRSWVHAALAFATAFFLFIIGRSSSPRSEYAWNIITGAHRPDAGTGGIMGVLDAMSVYLLLTTGVTAGLLLASALLAHFAFRHEGSRRVIRGLLVGGLFFVLSGMALIYGAKDQFKMDKDHERARFISMKPYFDDAGKWPNVAVVTSFRNNWPPKMLYLYGVVNNAAPLENRPIHNFYDPNSLPHYFDREARSYEVMAPGFLTPFRKEGSFVAVEIGSGAMEPSLSILEEELANGFRSAGDSGSKGLYQFYVFDESRLKSKGSNRDEDSGAGRAAETAGRMGESPE